MALLALYSAKGSPGLTTLAEALVAVFSRERPALLAELDPDGGDRAELPGLALQPGLASLAAAVRRGQVAEHDFGASLQPLPGGGHALVGPASADQAQAALASAVAYLAPALAGMGTWAVVADCGRARSSSPSIEVARHADLTVIVAHPTLAGIEHARERKDCLEQAGPEVGLVVVGRGPYGPAEIGRTIGCEVLGVVAHDRAGAQLVREGKAATRSGRRSLLMRSVGRLAPSLLAPVAPAPQTVTV